MVKKTNTERVWVKPKEIVPLQSSQQHLYVQQQDNDNQQHSCNIEESPYISQSSPNNHLSINITQQRKDQLILPQQQISIQKVQNEKRGFLITNEFISKLNQQVYKNIVLPEFIQTNNSYHSLNEEKQLFETVTVTEGSSKAQTVKQHERQRVTSFVFQKSLGIPSYYRQFQRSQQKNDQIQQLYLPTKMPKRDFLLYSNTILFDITNIKFLNIYGPTGSGKTYMLKTIFKHHSFQENVLWVNGMNILKGKTKRFLADIENKLNSLMWEVYQNNFKESKNAQQEGEKNFTKIFDNQNEKVLVIDEYDQASHFSMADLLKYAYLKQLQAKIKKSEDKKDIEIFYISKVILVANTFSTEINNQFGQQEKFNQNKRILYIENLIFRPFSQKQAQKILLKKINNVNMKFAEYLKKQPTIKSMFEENPERIFTEERLLILIKKICFGDEVDIRKILLFFANSIKKLSQLFHQKFQRNQKKEVKKFKNCFIDDKFLFDIINDNKPIIHEAEEIPKVPKFIQTVQDDDNPLIYYVFNLENEGKSILSAIHKQVVWKIKCEQESKKNQAIQKTNVKNKTNQSNTNKIYEKSSIQKKKQNIITVQDFYKKIRPRLQFTKIFHWLYEWQQVGLIRMRKDLSLQTRFDSPTTYHTSSSKIKIIDNYEIEVLNKLSIEKGLEIY